MGEVNASRADVARLLGRAAFGATAADLAKWTGRPYAELVDSLFPPLPADKRPPAPDEAKRTTFDTNNAGDFNSTRAMILWWMERMRSTLWPLEERMTYFWHDHFATAIAAPPNIAHMARQNQTLRVHALGDFRDLANAMTVDGAMLYWLSGYKNTRNAVNENYGREFFELFTNGTVPQLYSEDDVKEAAKAFTGFTVDTSTYAAKFTETRHVLGDKWIQGTKVGGYAAGDARNATEYKEVTEVALAMPTAARFIAYKLVTHFAYVPATKNTITDPDPLVDQVAAALAPTPAGPWDIKAAVRTLLLADEFRYAPAASGRQVVRTPIECIVHLGKALGQSLDHSYQQLQGTTLKTITVYDFLNAVIRAGQAPFYPPGVEGWPTSTDWLSQAYCLGRYELPLRVVQWWYKQQASTRVVLPPSGDVAGWVAFLGMDSISANTEAAVRGFLAAPGSPGDEITKQARVLNILSTSPEWQVM